VIPVFDSIGPYQVLGELGAGGMGTVYLARDLRLGRVVALKMMRAGSLGSDDSRRRLRLEAETAGSLDHPGIVPVLDAGEFDSRPYLAMKFIAGGSLAERLAEDPPGPEESARLVKSIAQAVDHAHQRGVLHRDIKPSNILLDEAGQPHLTDFGLAKFVSRESGLTVSHAPMGTCGYVAPEIAREGARAATLASDIYSLGAVLYELLAGRPPYVASSFGDFLRQIEQDDPPRPLEHPEGSARASRAGRDAPGPAAARHWELHVDPSTRTARTAGACREATHPTCSSVFPSATREARALPGKPAASPSRFLRDLELICLHCLNRDPRRRYPSAGALTEDLEHLLGGEPITARPPSPTEQLAVWVRRHRVAALVGSGVGLALLIGLGATLWQLGRAERFLAESRQANDELRRQGIHRSLKEFQVKSEERFRRAALQELALLHRRYPTNATIATRLWSALLERPHVLRHLPALSHQGQVYSAFFSSDGQRLLTAAWEPPTICLWDLQTGEKLGTIPHNNRIELAPLVTDHGRSRVVSVTEDNKAHVWRLPKLSEVSGDWTHLEAVSQTAISTSGATLAVTDTRPRLSLWNLETGAALWEAEIEEGPHRLCFSLDDRSVLVTGKSGNATLFSTDHGAIEAQIHSALGPLGRIEPAPDRRGFLLVGNTALWFEMDARSGGRHLAFTVTNAIIQAGRLSPDGHLATMVTRDNWLREFSLQTGEPTARVVNLGGGPDGLAYSPANLDIVVTTGDGVAWFIPHDAGKRRPEPVKAGVFCYNPQYSPDGQFIALPVHESKTHIFRPPPQLEENPITLVESNVVMWTVSPTGEFVGLWNTKGEVGLRRLAPDAPFEPRLQAESDVQALDVSPSGQWLMIRDGRGVARLLAVSLTHATPIRLEHDQGLTRAFSFSHGENRLALATESQVHIWDLQEASPRREAVFDVPRTRQLVLSPDGATLAIGDGDWQAQLYDTRTWQRIALLKHSGPVDQLQFSQDGRWIATGSQDRTARVWDTADGTPVTPILPNGFDGLCLSFHPSGEELYTGGWKTVIQRWQIPGGGSDPRVFSTAAPPHHLDSTKDGRWLVSGGEGFVQVWDVDSGTALLDPIPIRNASTYDAVWPRFTPDGNHLLITEKPLKEASATEHGTVSVIRLPLDDVPDSESLLALAQLCLDGVLNEIGGLEAFDDASLRDTYRRADPILRIVRPSRIRTLKLLKPPPLETPEP